MVRMTPAFVLAVSLVVQNKSKKMELVFDRNGKITEQEDKSVKEKDND